MKGPGRVAIAGVLALVAAAVIWALLPGDAPSEPALTAEPSAPVQPSTPPPAAPPAPAPAPAPHAAADETPKSRYEHVHPTDIPPDRSRVTLNIRDAVTDSRVKARVRVNGVEGEVIEGYEGWGTHRAFDLKPGTTVRAEIEADGYLPAKGRIETLPWGDSCRFLTVYLLPVAVELRGSVRDAEGSPVSGASVRNGRPPAEPSRRRWRPWRSGWNAGRNLSMSAVRSPAGETAWKHATESAIVADAAGTYLLRSFPGLRNHLQASHVYYFAADGDRATVQTPKGTDVLPDLLLGPGGAAGLTVTVDRPPPMRSGEKVKPRADGGELLFLHLEEDGRVITHARGIAVASTLGGLPPGRATVHVLPLGAAACPATAPADLAPRQTAHITVRPKAAPDLEGTVTDVGGRPIPEAWVIATWQWPGLPKGAEERPAADGKKLRDGARTEAEAAWARPGKRLSGWRPSGEVWLADITDSAGRFVLRGLPETGAELTVHYLDRAAWSGTGTPGTPLAVQLPDSAPDLIVALQRRYWGWDVELHDANGCVQKVRLDRGVALLSNLPEGDYSILAVERATYDREVAVAKCTIRADRVTRVNLSPLPQAAAMLHAVDAQTGAPIPATATVRVWGCALMKSELKPHRHNHVTPPARQRFALEVATEGYAPWSHEFTAEPGEQLRIGPVRLKRSDTKGR